MSKEKKSNWKKAIVVAGAITALGASAYFGEQQQPFTQLKEKITFHNVPPAPGTPANYTDWHVQRVHEKNIGALVALTDGNKTYVLTEELGPVRPETYQQYRSVVGKSPAPGTPKDFLLADIGYRLTDNNQVELFFGNRETMQYWKVNENWTAGSTGEQIDRFFKQLFNRTATQGADLSNRLQEETIRQYERAEQFFEEQKKQYVPADTTNQTIWDRMKENTVDVYRSIKDKLEK
jgi:hypothetical protein